MAQIENIQTGQSRGVNSKVVSIFKKSWAEAQQEESTWKVIGTSPVDMKGSNYLLMDKHSKAGAFREKGGGIQKTPLERQDTERRAIITKSFDAGSALDIDDLIDSSQDLLSLKTMEQKKEAARLCDRIILHANIAIVEDQKHDEKTDATRITANLSTTRHRRYMTFAKAKGVAANGQLAAFQPDNVEDINYLFGERSLYGTPVCTLTNELRKILRKDPQFQNLENLFTIDKRSADSFARGFSYRGITFVPTYNDVLPVLSTDDIATADGGNLSTVKTIHVRDLEEEQFTRSALAEDAAAPTKAAAKLAIGKSHGQADGAGVTVATVEVKSKDMVYFWYPEALKFAERAEATFARMGERDDYSYAKQAYMRVNIGATMIDDQYALSLALKGKVTSVLN